MRRATEAELKELVRDWIQQLLSTVWNADTDPEYVDRLAREIAYNQVRVAQATTPADREKHAALLAHLRQTIASEAVRRAILAGEITNDQVRRLLRWALAIVLDALFRTLATAAFGKRSK